MQPILPDALHSLGAVAASDTRFQIDMFDGNWWNSHRDVPEKVLVLKRNYLTEDVRGPTPDPGEQAQPLRLQLPSEWAGSQRQAQGEQPRWPGRSMNHLPAPAKDYTFRDFPALALHARGEDAVDLPAQKSQRDEAIAT